MRKLYFILFISIITNYFAGTLISLSNTNIAIVNISEIEETETEETEIEETKIDKTIHTIGSIFKNKYITENQENKQTNYSYQIKESVFFNVIFSPPDFC